MHSMTLPATPGAIIGYRKNGRPIKLIAGASGEEGESGGEGQGTAAGDGEGSGQQENGGGEPEGPGSPAEGSRDERRRFTGNGTGQGGDEAARTERTIAAIRQDFKDERAKRQAAEKRLGEIQAALDADKADRQRQMDALAVALGLKSGDEPPDPEKLAAELQAARDKAAADIAERDKSIRQSQVELAILRSAGRHGANGDALLDSRSFMTKVTGLDPASDSFAEDLADAIKAAMESGPQYKAIAAQAPAEVQQNGSGGERKPPAPSRSGGEHKAPGGNRQWTLADVDAASPSEVVAAQEQGLLVELGYPPRKSKR